MGANLKDAVLEAADFRGTLLEASGRLTKTMVRRFTDGTFEGTLKCANRPDSYLLDAGLRSSFLEGADFDGAILEDLNPTGDAVKFTLKANLEGAYLMDTDLQNAIIRDADPKGRGQVHESQPPGCRPRSTC